MGKSSAAITIVYFVYLVRCADDSLYAGITTDLDRRVNEHNTGQLGAKYTRVRRPVQLVYSAQHPNRSTASAAEASLKKLTREQKLALINEDHRK